MRILFLLLAGLSGIHGRGDRRRTACPPNFSQAFDNMLRISVLSFFKNDISKIGPCAPEMKREESRCNTLSYIKDKTVKK